MSVFAVTASSTLGISGSVSVPVNLGRFQRGDVIRDAIDTVDPPDDPPVLTITDESLAVLATLEVPLMAPPSMFGRPVFIGPSLALGTFLLNYRWTVGGVTHKATRQIAVVGGGDSGGSVISMCSYVRPESRYLIAQLSSGVLVQGRNPSL